MRKLNIPSVAVAFAGVFLGAGFVSGRELMQYFFYHGKNGLVSLCIALLFHAFFGFAAYYVAKKIGSTKAENVIVLKDLPLLRRAVFFISYSFLAVVFGVMSAGAGSLINRLTGLNTAAASLIFCTAVFFAAVFGVKGMVTVFDLLVPVLSVLSVIIAVVTLAKYGFSALDLTPVETENSTFFDCVSYISFDLLGAVNIIALLSVHIRDKKTASAGILLGAVLLGIIALSIGVSVCLLPAVKTSDLPMLETALNLWEPFGYVYGIILLLGMFSSSLSATVCIIEYISAKTVHKKRTTVISSAVLSVFAFGVSCVGFSTLVAKIYPFFGYFGGLMLLSLTGNFIYLAVKNKQS